MAPTYIKGGIWTNVEDEILRAAISKYGLNQWARVSSLLARKTAKQCKARWTEWLDPSIKKTEWSREEDEKLLHLAKIMPTRWRSIAEIVGRTASQCIERYQKLLDDAEASELKLSGDADASAPATGTRQLRVGDIDPSPETKPARPDQVDMDEEEKEMLSEARARLANTQGKKAKRKARERLLAESQRLTLLQKRRELKQAGINTKLKVKNKNSIDYNADIPFEHKPAPGFYDTREESEANQREKLEWQRAMEVKSGGMMLKESQKGIDKADGKKRTAEQRASAAEQAALARAEKLAELDMVEQLAKRRKLVLPEPQVRDDELEHVAKQARRITSDDSEQQNGFAVDSAPFADAPQDNARERVRRGLASLPKPKNDFEIVVEDEEQPEKSGADDVVGLVEDASERDRRLAAEKRAVLKQQFSKLSKVLQLGLPRPDADYEVDPDADAITKEMQRIIQSDNKSFPLGVDIEKHLSRSLFDNARTNGTNGISPDERLTIENMIDEELGNINSDILAGGDPREGHVCDNESTRSEIVDRLRRLAESSNKQQKKLELVLGGYMKRQSFLSAKLDEALNAVSGAEVERDTFVRLAEMEQIAISVRISSLQEEVNALTDAERRGQERYNQLRSIKGDLVTNGTSV